MAGYGIPNRTFEEIAEMYGVLYLRVYEALENLAVSDPTLAGELAAACGMELTDVAPEDPPGPGDGPHTQAPAGNTQDTT